MEVVPENCITSVTVTIQESSNRNLHGVLIDLNSIVDSPTNWKSTLEILGPCSKNNLADPMRANQTNSTSIHYQPMSTDMPIMSYCVYIVFTKQNQNLNGKHERKHQDFTHGH